MYSSLQVQVCWCMEPSMLRTEADAVNFNLIKELIWIFWPMRGPWCNTKTNQSTVNVNFPPSSRSSMSEPHGENQGEKTVRPLIGESIGIEPSDWRNMWLLHLNVEISASEATKTIGMGGGIREGPQINLHINLHCIECGIRLRAGAATHSAKCG